MTGEQRLNFRPVAALGKRTVPVLGQASDGSAFYEIEEDVYPPNPQADQLRLLRLSLGLGLREAHQRLGISPSSYCELERGRFDADWSLAEQLLRGEL